MRGNFTKTHETPTLLGSHTNRKHSLHRLPDLVPSREIGPARGREQLKDAFFVPFRGFKKNQIGSFF